MLRWVASVCGSGLLLVAMVSATLEHSITATNRAVLRQDRSEVVVFTHRTNPYVSLASSVSLNSRLATNNNNQNSYDDRRAPSNNNVTRCLVSPYAPNGWPEFGSPTDLLADRWGDYMASLYGEIPSSPDLYPWCMGSQWMFYDSLLLKHNVTDIPAVTSYCPAWINKTLNETGADGQRYHSNNPFQPSGISWSWHNPQPHNPAGTQNPFPNDTWVEVMHRRYPSDEKTGGWLFYAPGSGIWFNLGKTIVFQEHGNAFSFFNASYKINGTANNPMCQNNTNITTTNECMSHVAASMGYDTIQFMDTWPLDCVYNKTTTIANMNYEFVAVKMQGMYACISENGQSPLVRTGWRGSNTCNCTENGRSETANLNCNEVPL